MKVPTKLIDFLNQNGVEYELIHHPQVAEFARKPH